MMAPISLITIVKTKVCTEFGKFWKVMEIDNASIQNLESFGKREVFQNGYGEVLDFCSGQF